MDHVGPFGRRVRDVALLLNAMAGYDPADPYSSRRPVPDFTSGLGTDVRGLWAGVLTGTFFEAQLDPQIGRAFEAAVKTLESLGVRTKPVTFPLAAAAHAAGTIITVAEAASTQDETLRAKPDGFGADIQVSVGWSRRLSISISDAITSGARRQCHKPSCPGWWLGDRSDGGRHRPELKRKGAKL